MTNELGTTLQDIENKAERKREVLALFKMTSDRLNMLDGVLSWEHELETIRKYIEEN